MGVLFKWPLKTGFTVHKKILCCINSYAHLSCLQVFEELERIAKDTSIQEADLEGKLLTLNIQAHKFLSHGQQDFL